MLDITPRLLSNALLVLLVALGLHPRSCLAPNVPMSDWEMPSFAYVASSAGCTMLRTFGGTGLPGNITLRIAAALALFA